MISMTVKDLIDALKDLNPDLHIYVESQHCYDPGEMDISSVRDWRELYSVQEDIDLTELGHPTGEKVSRGVVFSG